jgi:hypothetical protein
MSAISPSPYQKPLKSVRPPLIPSEDETYKQEEGLFGSIGKLLSNAGASVVEIMGFRKKPQSYPKNNGQKRMLLLTSLCS